MTNAERIALIRARHHRLKRLLRLREDRAGERPPATEPAPARKPARKPKPREGGKRPGLPLGECSGCGHRKPQRGGKCPGCIAQERKERR